jgi:hypothetical protein
MRFTKLRIALAAAAMAGPALVSAQVPPNSRYFSVEEYFYRDSTGNYRPYRVAGFASPAQTGNPARLIILPTLYIDERSARFFDAEGRVFDPSAGGRAQTIVLEPRITNALPTQIQIPAIGGALTGVNEREHLMAPLLNTMNLPYMFEGHLAPPASYNWGNIAFAINQHYQAYTNQVSQQATRGLAYASHLPQQGNVSQLKVSLLVGGEVVATRVIPGNSISPNRVASISLQNPTPVQQNMIASGDYELELSYGFRDVSTASIQARLDAVAVVDQVLRETQTATTRNSSSGVQILGFGSRRTKIKSALDQQISSQHNETNIQGTSIVSYDATDAMIERFENAFFPKTDIGDVIRSHREAAAAARQQTPPNTRLAEVHEGYANALASSNQLAEVDMEKAAASLTAGDWAGFLAHGVRAASNNDRRVNEFRRVITNHEEIRRQNSWSELQQVTLQREATSVVRPPRTRDRPAYWGICGKVPTTFNAFVANSWSPGSWQGREGVLITCVHEGSPAAQANLVPGRIVTRIGSRPVRDLADWEEVTQMYAPGDQAQVGVFHHLYPMNVSEERVLTIRLRRGVPPPPGEQD